MGIINKVIHFFVTFFPVKIYCPFIACDDLKKQLAATVFLGYFFVELEQFVAYFGSPVIRDHAKRSASKGFQTFIDLDAAQDKPYRFTIIESYH